jgi:hypothetical protein
VTCQDGRAHFQLIDTLGWTQKKETIEMNTTEPLHANWGKAGIWISSIALVVAALIGAGAQLITEGPRGESRTAVAAPSPQLEQELVKANISLSETKPNQVLNWLRNDPPHRVLAQNCLAVLRGRRLTSPIPIPLDVIMGRYKEKLTGSTNAASTYLPPEKYNDLGKVREAILTAWEERCGPAPQGSFDQILEGVPAN